MPHSVWHVHIRARSNEDPCCHSHITALQLRTSCTWAGPVNHEHACTHVPHHIFATTNLCSPGVSRGHTFQQQQHCQHDSTPAGPFFNRVGCHRPAVSGPAPTTGVASHLRRSSSVVHRLPHHLHAAQVGVALRQRLRRQHGTRSARAAGRGGGMVCVGKGRGAKDEQQRGRVAASPAAGQPQGVRWAWRGWCRQLPGLGALPPSRPTTHARTTALVCYQRVRAHTHTNAHACARARAHSPAALVLPPQPY